MIKKTILIVDDIYENLYLLRVIFEEVGYNVIEAKDGSEGLKQLYENSNVDLIISDILMPIMDGYMFCQACKKEKLFKNIPFVFYTSTYTDKLDEDFALKLGAARFIRKPIDHDELIFVVKRIFDNATKPHKYVENAVAANEDVFKLYNERLISKLEQKSLRLEEEIIVRKKSELNLQENEKSLLEAQKIAKVGSYNLNLETQIAKTSTIFKEIVGLDLNSELTFDIWRKITHPEDTPINQKTFEHCLKTGENFNLEYRILTLNKKELKWIHGLGEVIFTKGEATNFFGTIQDITERKFVENKIAMTNDQLKQANNELKVLRNQLEQENIYLRNEIDLAFNYEEMVYGSLEFSDVLTEIEQVAPTTATVLLLGESGTGKELLARAIHNTSLRNNKPLIKVNCSAIPRELIESEFFGHKKGSYTGAISDRIGKFELADGGTLFLDEIGELPLDMQPKILRFLQEGEIEVVGGTDFKKLDVRVIAATNRNLKEEIEKKQFREDLYFRLNVFPIEVPPLRKRKDDIPLLVEHFMDKFNKSYAKNIKYIPDDSMNQLKSYDWPGNIRELENLIERASILSTEETLLIPGFESKNQKSKTSSIDKNLSLDYAQRNHIQQILEQCNWKISGPNGAAILLDLKASTLRDKMTKLGIVRPLKK